MTSSERILKYTKLEQEPAKECKIDSELKGKWPSKGDIVFKNIKMRYREDLDFTLKGFNLVIKGGEKIGCIGRTGAGKSSII